MFSASVSLAILYLRIYLLLQHSSVQLHGVYVEYILNMNRQNSGNRNKRERGKEKEKEASRLCRPLPKLQAGALWCHFQPACNQEKHKVQMIVWIAKGTSDGCLRSLLIIRNIISRLLIRPLILAVWYLHTIRAARHSAVFITHLLWYSRSSYRKEFFAIIMDSCESSVTYKYIDKLFAKRERKKNNIWCNLTGASISCKSVMVLN